LGITRDAPQNLDLEVHEDGVLRLRCSALFADRGSEATINDIAINGLVKRVILAAAQLSTTCSYFGSWGFAISPNPPMSRR